MTKRKIKTSGLAVFGLVFIFSLLLQTLIALPVKADHLRAVEATWINKAKISLRIGFTDNSDDVEEVMMTDSNPYDDNDNWVGGDDASCKHEMFEYNEGANSIPFLYRTNDGAGNCNDHAVIVPEMRDSDTRNITAYRIDDDNLLLLNTFSRDGGGAVSCGGLNDKWDRIRDGATNEASIFTRPDEDERDADNEYLQRNPDGSSNALTDKIKVVTSNSVSGELKVVWIATLGQECSNDYEITISDLDIPEIYGFDEEALVPLEDISTGTEAEIATCSSESGSSFGWILCPVIEHAYEFLDWIYRNALEPVLKIDIESTEDLTEIWNGFRLIANMIFIIAFIIVIYSAATGNIMSAYDVRKLLPRLFIVAILVQLSFFLSITALQISNELGAGIQNIITLPLDGELITIPGLLGVEDGNSIQDAVVTFVDGAASIVSGIVVIIFLAGALIMSLSGIVLLIGVFLIRALGILILIVISPIAFSLAVLPGTDNYFRKWWKWYFGLLTMYPIMAAFLASGQLFANVITKSDLFKNAFLNSIMATVVLFVPFFVAPQVLKFAGQAMGTVSGLMNGIKDGGNKLINSDAGKRTRARVKGGAYSRLNRYGDTDKKSSLGRRGVSKFMGTKSMTRRAGYGISGLESIEQDDVKAAAVLLGQKTSGLESQQEEAYLRSITGGIDPKTGKVIKSSASTGTMRAAMARMIINKDFQGIENAFEANEDTATGKRMIERFKADNAGELGSAARPLLLGQERTQDVKNAAGKVIGSRKESRRLAGARMFTGSTHEKMASQNGWAYKETAKILQDEIKTNAASSDAVDQAYASELQGELNKMFTTYSEIFTDPTHGQLKGSATSSREKVNEILRDMGRPEVPKS